jgi:hypothetical protein
VFALPHFKPSSDLGIDLCCEVTACAWPVASALP